MVFFLQYVLITTWKRQLVLLMGEILWVCIIITSAEDDIRALRAICFPLTYPINRSQLGDFQHLMLAMRWGLPQSNPLRGFLLHGQIAGTKTQTRPSPRLLGTGPIGWY